MFPLQLICSLSMICQAAAAAARNRQILGVKTSWVAVNLLKLQTQPEKGRESCLARFEIIYGASLPQGLTDDFASMRKVKNTSCPPSIFPPWRVPVLLSHGCNFPVQTFRLNKARTLSSRERQEASRSLTVIQIINKRSELCEREVENLKRSFFFCFFKLKRTPVLPFIHHAYLQMNASRSNSKI